eukprot:1578606-Rhodomonas_salina.1
MIGETSATPSSCVSQWDTASTSSSSTTSTTSTSSSSSSIDTDRHVTLRQPLSISILPRYPGCRSRRHAVVSVSRQARAVTKFSLRLEPEKP